jgi:hypothetical protein
MTADRSGRQQNTAETCRRATFSYDAPPICGASDTYLGRELISWGVERYCNVRPVNSSPKV